MSSSKKKKSLLTPLQLEAEAKMQEIRRRQEALRAAQAYAIRGALEKKRVHASTEYNDDSSSSNGSFATAVSTIQPDFDQVRAALRCARHSDAKKNRGENPRIVSVLDDKREQDGST